MNERIRNAEIHVGPVGSGSFILDGHDMSNGIRGFELTAEAGQLTVLRLDVMVIDDIHVNGEVRTVIPNGAREALIKLGWTPPKDDE